MFQPSPIPAGLLNSAITARSYEGVNGLRVHTLQAGVNEPDRPCLLLLHGFPELAFSWRRVMAPLAQAGYFVVAPDLRGYGRTGPARVDFDSNLRPWSIPNVVRDNLSLLNALGRASAAVIGHDYGSTVACWSALIRPDRFTAVTHMSGPFGLPKAANRDGSTSVPVEQIGPALAALERPRRHYQDYYRTRSADREISNCDQGLGDFLRAYYHFKSGDHSANDTHPLAGWTALEISRLPTYYVLDLGTTMAQAVAQEMPTADQIAACQWLTEPELDFYRGEFARTGLQGALNSYRVAADRRLLGELELFTGRNINVPGFFIGGQRDWGVHQRPGGLAGLDQVFGDLRGVKLVPGAGHWIQQEAPAAVVDHILNFLAEVDV